MVARRAGRRRHADRRTCDPRHQRGRRSACGAETGCCSRCARTSAFWRSSSISIFSSAPPTALLDALGLHLHAPSLAIILPVGLSFYTFQAISRTIDSYQRRYEPQYSIVNYAAFHAFFPQLVAGPIERAGHLMPQFETVRPFDRQTSSLTGALLFAWGLYQKIVIADNVAPIANAVFNSPAHHTAGATLAAVLAFTVQIYCDFCGYSNMARGLARCLGFDLMINFNQPYFARSPSEFWQRWHISLSRWLRDYLYIPLGGNRGGRLKMYRNLMITMLLGGLWHGASWTFVAWGAFHGAIQVLYRALRIDSLVEGSRFLDRARICHSNRLLAPHDVPGLRRLDFVSFAHLR